MTASCFWTEKKTIQSLRSETENKKKDWDETISINRIGQRKPLTFFSVLNTLLQYRQLFFIFWTTTAAAEKRRVANVKEAENVCSDGNPFNKKSTLKFDDGLLSGNPYFFSFEFVFNAIVERSTTTLLFTPFTPPPLTVTLTRPPFGGREGGGTREGGGSFYI